jgi:hypothetical protein
MGCPLPLNHSQTPDANRKDQGDRVVVEGESGSDEECVEEIFGQLWFVPKPDSERPPIPHRDSGRLVWIR